MTSRERPTLEEDVEVCEALVTEVVEISVAPHLKEDIVFTSRADPTRIVESPSPVLRSRVELPCVSRVRRSCSGATLPGGASRPRRVSSLVTDSIGRSGFGRVERSYWSTGLVRGSARYEAGLGSVLPKSGRR